MAHLVDWELAARTGARLVPPGPTITRDEGLDLVAALRSAAETAVDHVREVTHMTVDATPANLVVDRPGWIRANCQSMPALLPGRASTLAARAAGVETGALLAVLAPRVLGQFDPFTTPGGRLLLNAPNILAASTRLDLPADQFRLWVCLHEQTHRAQFHHAPWLVDHLRDRITRITMAIGWRWGDALAAVREVVGRGGDSAGLLGAFIDPSARDAVDEISAVMTLLEGHADVMMDRVGTGVLPALPRLRRRFNHKRSADDGLLSRLLGLSAKQRQYRDGAVFCRRVIARLGVAGLNEAFSGPDALPTMTDIHDPQGWIAARRAGVA